MRKNLRMSADADMATTKSYFRRALTRSTVDREFPSGAGFAFPYYVVNKTRPATTEFPGRENRKKCQMRTINSFNIMILHVATIFRKWITRIKKSQN